MGRPKPIGLCLYSKRNSSRQRTVTFPVSGSAFMCVCPRRSYISCCFEYSSSLAAHCMSTYMHDSRCHSLNPVHLQRCGFMTNPTRNGGRKFRSHADKFCIGLGVRHKFPKQNFINSRQRLCRVLMKFTKAFPRA